MKRALSEPTNLPFRNMPKKSLLMTLFNYCLVANLFLTIAYFLLRPDKSGESEFSRILRNKTIILAKERPNFPYSFQHIAQSADKFSRNANSPKGTMESIKDKSDLDFNSFSYIRSAFRVSHTVILCSFLNKMKLFLFSEIRLSIVRSVKNRLPIVYEYGPKRSGVVELVYLFLKTEIFKKSLGMPSTSLPRFCVFL